MSQDLLLDLNDVGISEYKSVYSIEDQSKMDFINLLEERIMNKVNKLFVKKDEEIGALIDIIGSQKDEIGRLNTELHSVKEKLSAHEAIINWNFEKFTSQSDEIDRLKEKLSAHQLMTDGIFENLTKKINKNYLSIKGNNKIIKGLYNLYEDFEYGELCIGNRSSNEFTKYYMNIYDNYLSISYYDTIYYKDLGGFPFDINIKIFNLSNLNYIKVNVPYNKFNCMLIRFIIRNNDDINTFKKHNILNVGRGRRYHDGDGFYSENYNIIILMLLLNINIIVDSGNNSINIRELDKPIINIDSQLNSEDFKLLKNALIECGYITI